MASYAYQIPKEMSGVKDATRPLFNSTTWAILYTRHKKASEWVNIQRVMVEGPLRATIQHGMLHKVGTSVAPSIHAPCVQSSTPHP